MEFGRKAMAPSRKPCQLLEINVISAQDLEPVSKKMRTHAVAWMNPNRKLSTSVDTEGKTNPTWNDKFVFKVDEEFLRRDTSAVMIEIYAKHWFRDVIVGTVRVLVGNLIPPTAHSHNHIGMRFVALQVRRPSGRPQGILNIGVALLDDGMRGMALYRQLSMSAVGYRDLMEDQPFLQHLQDKQQQSENDNNNNDNKQPSNPALRRTKSERSELLAFNLFSPGSSMVGVTKIPPKESSILSITDSVVPYQAFRKAGKASSVISGAELREKPKLIDNKGKAASVLSDSALSKQSSVRKIEGADQKTADLKNEGETAENNGKGDEKLRTDEGSDNAPNKLIDEKSVTKAMEGNNVDPIKAKPLAPIIRNPVSNYNGYDHGAPKVPMPPGKHVVKAPLKKGNSVWSESDVGPSPSEVAAAMAEKKYPLEDNESSVLDGWSLDESVEGLRSKLQRWRTELPPLDNRSSSSSLKSSGRHTRNRRPNSNGTGLFSCFGNILGYECQCICGQPQRRRSRGGGKFQSPSTLTPGRSFL